MARSSSFIRIDVLERYQRDGCRRTKRNKAGILRMPAFMRLLLCTAGAGTGKMALRRGEARFLWPKPSPRGMSVLPQFQPPGDWAFSPNGSVLS